MMFMFLYYALQPQAYCAIRIRRSSFRHQASPRVSPRESTQRRKVELWARNVREFFPKCRLPRYIQGSLTCRKATTCDRRLYFPSEGRRAEDFFALKIRRLRPGVNPANLGTKGQHATSRPPKPLIGKMILTEQNKNQTRAKSCLSLALYLTNLTRNYQELNPGFQCKRPVKDILNHGTACVCHLFTISVHKPYEHEQEFRS